MTREAAGTVTVPRDNAARSASAAVSAAIGAGLVYAPRS